MKSPAEKIMDLLESIKRSTKDKDLIKELNWAIEIISTNKLYDPILEAGGDGQKDKSEVILRNFLFIVRLAYGLTVVIVLATIVLSEMLEEEGYLNLPSSKQEELPLKIVTKSEAFKGCLH